MHRLLSIFLPSAIRVFSQCALNTTSAAAAAAASTDEHTLECRTLFISLLLSAALMHPNSTTVCATVSSTLSQLVYLCSLLNTPEDVDAACLLRFTFYLFNGPLSCIIIFSALQLLLFIFCCWCRKIDPDRAVFSATSMCFSFFFFG